MKSTLLFLGLCLSIGQQASAQLPEDYITKVTYLERKQVSFEMAAGAAGRFEPAETGPNPAPYGRNCLTLGELSRYHAFRQDIFMTQYVDRDGELLTDKRILFEQDIRDNWMEPYTRVVLGKETYEVYGTDDKLLFRFNREELSNSANPEPRVYMRIEEGVNYQHFVLDDAYYGNLVSELQNSPVPVHRLANQSGILTAELDSATLLYDHNRKLLVVTEYDWVHENRKKETVILYDLTEDGSGYAPLQEIISEWFHTEKGCCILKTTIITREHFRREVNAAYRHLIQPMQAEGTEYSMKAGGDYSIHSIPGTGDFIIQSEKHKGQILHIAVYDLNGKLLGRQEVTEGTPIAFPEVSAGLYLVQVLDKKSGRQVLHKVVKPDTGKAF